MQPLVIDTSLWVEWLRGREGAARDRCRNRVVYLPAIVALELLSGSRDRRSYRLIEDLIGTFSRNRRLLVHTYEDYELGGNTLSELGWPASKQTGDTLIAASARRIGAEVWTKDNDDFYMLSKRLGLEVVSNFK